jgi:hypothetical protein
VEYHGAANRDGKTNAIGLFGAFARRVKLEYPDAAFSQVYASGDRTRAVATVSYAYRGQPLKGRFYFEASPGRALVQGYYAPAAELESKRGLLLDILANLRFVTPSRGGAGAPSAADLTPIQVDLIPRQAPDGSLRISLPSDWNFQAGGGRVLAVAPMGRAGFMFSSIEVMPSNYGVAMPQNVIVAPYSPPGQFVHVLFSQFGNRNLRVEQLEVDQATMQAFPMHVGRQCQAADMVLSWTSPEGANCLGVLKMINAVPSVTGIWFSIFTGFWGSQEEFLRYVPLLERVGASFSINDRYSQDYIRQGLANLRRLQAETQRRMQELNQARYDNQAAWERRQERKAYMDSKWDDYRRGRSYWISEMEGGKVYETDPGGTRDTETGQYYEGGQYTYVHFEGENPRHPSESMREVSSYEVQRHIEGRSP